MDQEFFQKIAVAAAEVVKCETCQEQSRIRNTNGLDLGLTQPGWVGPQYQPGSGLVFVLQNPGVGGIKRQGNEGKYQSALRELSENPTTDEYLRFVEIVMQMVPGWPMWNRHVNNVVDGCLSPRQIAWLNTVKFRTPNNDALLTNEKKHGIEQHLSREISLLKPAVVVSIGAVAQEAVNLIEAASAHQFHHENIRMRGSGSGEASAHIIRGSIRSWGYCNI